jgi:hypothetical protein
MTTSKLSLYNGALRLLGERRLSSLTEDRPARHYLDAAYDDGLIDYLLEQGQWNFATRSVELTNDSSITPEFGYQYGFAKPADYVRLAALCLDEYFKSPLNEYSDEQGYWFCDYDTLYIKYISNDVDYGLDLSLWPQTFVRYAQAELADRVKEEVTGNDGKYERIKKALKDARVDARSKDVMNRPVRFQPAGTFVKARMTSGVNNDG